MHIAREKFFFGFVKKNQRGKNTSFSGKENYAERFDNAAQVFWQQPWNILFRRVPICWKCSLTTKRPEMSHATRNDEEINKLLIGVTISQRDVLPKKTDRKDAEDYQIKRLFLEPKIHILRLENCI